MFSSKKFLPFCICTALLFILSLAACDAPGSPQGVGATGASPFVPGDGTPKGPGSAGLTATALATPTSVNCQLPPLASPANTQGRKIYVDKRFPFRFAIPPEWTIGQTLITDANSTASDYEVMVLPPTGHTPINAHSNITEPEYIQLTVILTGPGESFSNESTWISEPAPISLSHASTKLSYRISPDCGEFNRATDPVAFGQHRYFFYEESRDRADKSKDSQIFLSMLQSFVYTGAK